MTWSRRWGEEEEETIQWTVSPTNTGTSKSQVSRLCEEIDERVQAFLNRPIEGEWPYLWIDATYIKSRQGGRIVSTAAIVAVGANAEGKREVLGLAIGESEAFGGKSGPHPRFLVPPHPPGRTFCGP